MNHRGFGRSPAPGHNPLRLCHLGNLATRLGRTLDFDSAKVQSIGGAESNTLVRRRPVSTT